MAGDRIAAIVLAAGGSRRMGAPKMLADLGGRPLVRHAVDAALASRVDEVWVVTGPANSEVRLALSDRDVYVVHNPAWAAGLAGSIRAGLEACSGADAVIVILGDQPALTPAILDALIDAHGQGRPLAACVYENGAVGPPALFARAHFPALLSLEGDRGAHALLRDSDPRLVPFPAGALDVDTPEDLERARRAHS